MKIDFYFIRQTSIYCLKFQGQALSTLVRAYLESKDDRCLAAAEDGVRVFSISSSEGGVRAVLMDKYEWYEEYPTNPPTFILNGFMYSLLGLYDLIKVSVWVRWVKWQARQPFLDSSFQPSLRQIHCHTRQHNRGCSCSN